MLFKVNNRKITDQELLRFEEELSIHIQQTNLNINYDDLDYFIELVTDIHNLCQFDRLKGLKNETIITSNDRLIIIQVCLNYEVDRGILNHLKLASIHGDISNADLSGALVMPDQANNIVSGFTTNSVSGERLIESLTDIIYKFRNYNFLKSTETNSGHYVEDLTIYNSNENHLIGIRNCPLVICNKIRHNSKHDVHSIKLGENNRKILH